MPVSMLGHSKSASEFSYMATASRFLPKYPFLIYTRKQQGSKALERAQIGRSVRMLIARVPKTGVRPKQVTDPTVKAPCMRHAGKRWWRMLDPCTDPSIVESSSSSSNPAPLLGLFRQPLLQAEVRRGAIMPSCRRSIGDQIALSGPNSST